MPRILAFVLACLLAAIAAAGAWAQAPPAQQRVALVIGNSQYQSERIPDLANPANDAEDIARALKGFGFAVELRQDLDKPALTAALSDFAVTAKQADVALFYYAGHGMQLDLRNYLVPSDAEYTNQADVINRSVALDTLTGAVEGMQGSLLIFLDACQENPLGERDGLARIPVSQNQFVALAALPDHRAADGAGRNSPFTEAFLANAGVPGRNISDVMMEVRLSVLAATGSQVPWDNSSLTQQIVFVPGDASVLPPETMLWRTASSLADSALLNVYLERFPEGGHAAEARTLLASVSASAVGGTEFRSTPLAVDGTQDEGELWQLASSSRWRPLLVAFIERFPDSSHIEAARELVGVLKDPDDPNQPPTFTCERLATHPNDETAAFAGVPAARLALNAQAAIDACRLAHSEFPDVHKYTAMLARALYVGGQSEEAIGLFRAAAAAGNIRAMTTLGAFYETGTGVAQDLAMAADFYQRASDAGAADATVNLARMLAEARGVPQDIPRAVQLLETAS
ncbi:MAG TPA: caspase family protein, partial [Devosia sp.]|nr:caspase family protein [Devosia sp.]